jgi:hypothetical protein
LVNEHNEQLKHVRSLKSLPLIQSKIPLEYLYDIQFIGIGFPREGVGLIASFLSHPLGKFFVCIGVASMGVEFFRFLFSNVIEIKRSDQTTQLHGILKMLQSEKSFSKLFVGSLIKPFEKLIFESKNSHTEKHLLAKIIPSDQIVEDLQLDS